MKPARVFLLLIFLVSVFTGAAGRKPLPLQPARPFAEAAADFYPEIEKQYKYYQQWASTADETGMEACRRQYREAIIRAFGEYRIRRRRELSQTRWPQQLELLCKGTGPEVQTCEQNYTAPRGQEWEVQNLRVTGRPLTGSPQLSADRRRLTATLQKKGVGTSRSRILLYSRMSAPDVETQIDMEQNGLRRKLELHGLPSDVTLSRYPL
jgi:hypothetical protein